MKKIITGVGVIILIALAALLFRIGNKETPGEVQEIGEDGRVTLQAGEIAGMDDITLVFNEVVADYRCARDEECLEGGAITANMTFSIAGASETRTIAQDEVPSEFGNYTVAIVDVAPPRELGVDIAPEDYEVTFEVREQAEEAQVAWEDVPALLSSGEVSQVIQLHSLEVRFTLENGSEFIAIEPEIDEIFRVLEECGEECRNIIVATE